MKRTDPTLAARLLAGLLLVSLAGCQDAIVQETWAWAQRQAEPGPLDPAHAELGLDCAACHTPLRGVEADGCIACHALNGLLVQRQTTAFHAEARVCADCHVEHTPAVPLRAPLDHDLLAALSADWPVSDRRRVERGMASLDAASLDCSSCHSNQDPHFQLFGEDCMQCHETATWDVVSFAHPTPRSRDCAQCHQAPPSHYMEHFKMLSAKVARQPHAEVDECYQCHLTTSWPDIRGVGFYKHH